MIVVSAALKGGVGKTTTSVYLAAVASDSDRPVTLVDADPQASAAEWVEEASDVQLQRLKAVEAPTERLLAKALDRVAPTDVVIVDTPPAHQEMLAKALGRASAVVIPTRVGGVETPTATTALDMVPEGVPAGLVICSARTFTRDYHEAIANWQEDEAPVWGTVPERVAIAQGPDGWLAVDGLDAYGELWRRVQRAVRSR
ncbi:MAG TPA: ParA family protein [Jiangellaceae bacterium]|nr:ParA family protein [Jiangellaceae bacterium]